jgi:hypothetical protein
MPDTESKDVVVADVPQRAIESRDCAKSDSSTPTNTNSSSWESYIGDEENAIISRCPTRLLIRRRSLRVVEEGGGTHIYAIRYPEDTSQMVVSEQAAPLAPMVRQEQCPPRNKTVALVAQACGTSNILMNATENDSHVGDNNNDNNDSTTKAASKQATNTTAISQQPPLLGDPSSPTPKSKSNTEPSSSKANPSSATAEKAGDVFAANRMTAPPKRKGMIFDHNTLFATILLFFTCC